MRLSVIDKIEDEIRTIEAELHEKLPKEIQKARELGDLSENAEYSSAKERQRLLNARLAQLAQRLGKLRMIDLSKIPRDAVGLGSTVVLYDVDEDKQLTYELVTSEESDVPAGNLDHFAYRPSLIGKREGDSATAHTPRGNKEFEVVSMQTIYTKGGNY